VPRAIAVRPLLVLLLLLLLLLLLQLRLCLRRLVAVRRRPWFLCLCLRRLVAAVDVALAAHAPAAAHRWS
jgi:hypothetical protein